MTDQYLGEIRMVGFNFAPIGWAFCQGQILSIAQNTALFSLLGTQFGGNGTSNFALPDLRDRVPINFGQGPGLSPYLMGETGGVAAVTLTTAQIPPHTHDFFASTVAATTAMPNGAVPAAGGGSGRGGSAFNINMYAASAAGTATTLAPTQLTTGASGNQAHNNLQPYLAVNYIIALGGIFPPRS